jgi:hypothetical protein
MRTDAVDGTFENLGLLSAEFVTNSSFRTLRVSAISASGWLGTP